MRRRIAIVGGGIAGITAAWQLARLAADGKELEVVLFEASVRLGGIVETVRESGFTIECGPDAWVTEKPWAAELASDLGLSGEIMASNDATRKTYILLGGKLVAIPDGMRMMVPSDLGALDRSHLFSEEAKAAFRAEAGRGRELRTSAPEQDESVASFVERHFGQEVLEKVASPLLSGVFGGDVTKLSVRAVMAPFVAMEREHGSLVVALQERAGAAPAKPVFTTLRHGAGTLTKTMAADIPQSWIRLGTAVTGLSQDQAGWHVASAGEVETFDLLMLATPVDVTRRLLRDIDREASGLMEMEASSAVVAGFGFKSTIDLPAGFGFLVPPKSSESSLIAGTFVDQKFAGRVPAGCRLLRGFFGGAAADRLLTAEDEEIARLALNGLEQILGSLPEPIVTIVRRWPNALPQYAVGHLERMTMLFKRVEAIGSLWLLGNGYRGVGLPDLIRDARAAACEAASGSL